MKLGRRRHYHEGRAAIRHYDNLRELSFDLRFKLLWILYCLYAVCCMLVSHRAPVIVPARNLGSATVRTLGYLVDSVSRDQQQSIWCLPPQLHWIYTHSPSQTHEAWSLSKSEQKLRYSIYTSSQPGYYVSRFCGLSIWFILPNSHCVLSLWSGKVSNDARLFSLADNNVQIRVQILWHVSRVSVGLQVNQPGKYLLLHINMRWECRIADNLHLCHLWPWCDSKC